MHGLSRLSNGVGSLSPPSSPRHRSSRGKSPSSAPGIYIGGVGAFRGGGRAESKNVVERFGYFLISAIYRRRGVLLFAPLLYISGILLYMGIMGFDSVNNTSSRNGDVVGPGSVYRSPEVFEKLWPSMEAESNRSSNMLMNVWNPKLRQGWKPCIKHTVSKQGFTELPKSNGYLIIEANGGLNQQRLSICDAVAVAGLLNATLVIPIFHLNSVWQDSSKFGDIFDEEFFIYALRNHVNVIRELPEDVLQEFDHNISNIVNLRVKAWSSPKHYLEKVLPKLLELKAVRIAPFSNRLAHAVPQYIQGLRCLCNFEALRFSGPIRMLAAKMVDQMVKTSSKSGGRYVSVHLRFEEDMVAFSCCIYDGGEEEKHEMDIVRERSWRGKFRRRGRVIRPGANRVDGKCPLTPLEVGMILRGMGFDTTTQTKRKKKGTSMGISKMMMKKVALLLVLLAKVAQSQDTTSFTFNSFVPNPTDLTYQGDADVPSGSGALRLTRTNTAGNPLSGSVGRVLYSRPVQFWDANRQATFETTIEFNIRATDNDPADGITFFIAPVNSAIPAGSSGGNLGIFGASGTGTSIFAVEFDTYVNGAWDPPYRHMGVDVNSRNSLNTTRFDSLGIVSARINYNSNTRTVTVTARSNASGNVTLSSVVNLKSVLPQQVQVGLSASTGVQVSLHDIRSWYFSSTLVWDASNQLDQDRTYLRLN